MSHVDICLHKILILVQNIMRQTYTTKLFTVYLKFEFNGASHILSGSYIS